MPAQPVHEEQAVPEGKPAEVQALPQGPEAASLAALARPRHAGTASVASTLPLIAARDFTPAESSGIMGSGSLPLPSPPGSPAASSESGKTDGDTEGSLLDLFSLKSLPIPSFGGLQTAHAASLDMPVPPTPAPQSPFTPAEQAAPLGRSARVIPGAPDIPQNLLPNSVPPQTVQTTAALPPNATTPTLLSPPAPNVPDPAPRDVPGFKAGELERQQQDMLMLRQQMDQRLKDLQNAEKKMKEMLKEAKGLEDQKIRSLVQMYANMKPRTAAQAMENMDERVAVRILAGMPPKQSGEILTYTNPSKTAKFTELITRMRMAD